jgi:hypothetical protein
VEFLRKDHQSGKGQRLNEYDTEEAEVFHATRSQRAA